RASRRSCSPLGALGIVLRASGSSAILPTHETRFIAAIHREIGRLRAGRNRRYVASEIRLVCSRDRGLLSWEPLGVFGANMFRPFNQRAAIRYGRRPGHPKGAFILDRESELQVPASIARVPGPPGDLILPCVPFHSFFRGFVIDEPISFDHVQSLCVWR